MFSMIALNKEMNVLRKPYISIEVKAIRTGSIMNIQLHSFGENVRDH